MSEAGSNPIAVTIRKLLLVVFVLAGFCLPARAQLVPVASNCVGNASGSTTACTVTVAANQLIYVGANVDDGAGGLTGTPVTDTCGGGLTWTVAQNGFPTGSGTMKQYAFFAETGSCTGSVTVTVHFTLAITNGAQNAIVLAGIATSSPQDGSTATNSGSSTCAAQTDCTVTNTTTNSEDIILSVWWHNGFINSGNCCQFINTIFGGGTILNWSVTSGSVVSAMVDGNSGPWSAVAVAFKWNGNAATAPIIQSLNLPCLGQNGQHPCTGNSRNLTIHGTHLVTVTTSFCLNAGCTNAGSGTLSVSDLSAGSWQSVTTTSCVETCEWIFWKVLSAGANTITLTPSSGPWRVSAVITEWNTNPPIPCDIGCSTFTGSGTGTSVISSNTQLLAQTTSAINFNNELIIGANKCFAACTGAVSAVVPDLPLFVAFPGFAAYAILVGQSGHQVSLTWNLASPDSNNFYEANIAGFAYVPASANRPRSQIYE